MSEEKNESNIVLTLEPQAAAQGLEATASTATAADSQADVKPAPLDVSQLTESELKQVDEFAKKIDLSSTDIILQYGSSAQKKIADFSDVTLKDVKTKDLGQIGDMISGLVTELKGFDIESKDKGIVGWFKKSANNVTNLKARYDTAEVNVTKIANLLEDHQIQLLKDVTILDELFERNTQNKKELTMYILAGQQKLKEANEVELPKMVKKAEESGTAEDAQAAKDYADLIHRFEKKLHDLELTRMIAVQMGPQIRLIQNNDTLMAEKIQSTLVNTIPLWKSQMVIALGLNHSKEAVKAEQEVDEMTNTLLKKNAENLKTATIDTAKESEKGIVEIETLQYTNKALIETMEEVLKIQTEGRQKRQQAEVELRKLEGELREKLLEINGK